MIDSIPKNDNPEKEQYVGAYVNCWVKEGSKEEALQKAEEYIDSQGWIPQNIEEYFLVERSRYLGNEDDDIKESLRCFDLAIEYGVCGAIYCYDNEPANEF